MAKIDNSVGIEGASATFVSVLASLGVMMCLIVSLLGIKIWWFKHRLNFDQSSTRNGAAGGAQPAVVVPRATRQRGSKDKRLSQQVSESVVVHGVFRKRQEDDLEYERPNQLPPVRIRNLSQSTPSLLTLPMPPPRRRVEDSSYSTSVFSVPPTRDPPKPPTPETLMKLEIPLRSTNQTAANNIEVAARGFDAQFDKIEHISIPPRAELQQETLWKAEAPAPQAPKRLNRSTSKSNDDATAAPAQDSGRKFLKAKPTSALEPIYRPAYPERRLTGFFKPDDEDKPEENQPLAERHALQSATQIEEIEEKTEQFGERRPTGYIKYEMVDTGAEKDFVDFHEKWDNMKLGRNETVVNQSEEQSYQMRSDYSHYAGSEEINYNWNTDTLDEERGTREYLEGLNENVWNTKFSDGRHQEDSINTRLRVIDLKKHIEPMEYFSRPDEKVWNTTNNDFDSNQGTINIDLNNPKLQDLEEHSPVAYLQRQDEQMWDNNNRIPQSNSYNFRSEEILESESKIEAEKDKVPIFLDYTDGTDISERSMQVTHVDDKRELNKIDSQKRNDEENTSPITTKPRTVKFLIPNNNADDYDENASDDAGERDDRTWQVRRPTGYVRREQPLWADLEESVSSHADDSDKNLWLEMEKDILQTDFASNIEQEFNKIRHSYEENEADFLETKKRTPLSEARATITTSTSDKGRDMGFGKSIDEDWENFEQLEETTSKVNNRAERVLNQDKNNTERDFLKYDPVESRDYVEQKTRTEKHEHASEVYQSHNTGLYQDITERFTRKVVTFEETEEVVFVEEEIVSAIQARRPTGFVKRDLDQFKEELAATENNVRRKVKPRQKVTFDFNTEEYYLPAEEDESDYDSEAPVEVLKHEEIIEIPKPMLRMTKMHYTMEDHNENDVDKVAPPNTTPPILFSTQISREDSPDITANDSWSAIRQHRHLTEEFQQLSLDSVSVAGNAKPIIKPAPRHETSKTQEGGASRRDPPKPAFRNPLAQMAVGASSSVTHIASKHQLNFTEYSTSSTTEA